MPEREPFARLTHGLFVDLKKAMEILEGPALTQVKQVGPSLQFPKQLFDTHSDGGRSTLQEERVSIAPYSLENFSDDLAGFR